MLTQKVTDMSSQKGICIWSWSWNSKLESNPGSGERCRHLHLLLEHRGNWGAGKLSHVTWVLTRMLFLDHVCWWSPCRPCRCRFSMGPPALCARPRPLPAVTSQFLDEEWTLHRPRRNSSSTLSVGRPGTRTYGVHCSVILWLSRLSVSPTYDGFKWALWI